MSSPTITDGEVADLVGALTKFGGRWVRIAELIDVLGWDRRRICAVSACARGRIIGTTAGYKLQDHASSDEVLHAYSRMTDIIGDCQARANAIMAWYKTHHASQVGTGSHVREPTPAAAQQPALALDDDLEG